MPLKLSNNASSILASSITTTSLALTVQDGSKFPTPAAGEWFPVTVVDSALRVEIMRAVGRAGNTISLDPVLAKARGQEGTIAYAFAAGARVDVRLTAGALYDATSNADNLMTGIIKDALLPARIATTGSYVADADTVTVFGRFRVDAATANIPAAATGFLWNDVYSATTMFQEYQQTGTSKRWARRKSTTWGAWYPLLLTEGQVPIGTIVDFAGKVAPETPTKQPPGWLICDGSPWPTSSPYDLLYAVIGTQYGVGGAGTFRVPDLRGRVVAGKDNMGGAGTSAGRLNGQTGSINGDSTIGTAGGVDTVILTDGQIPKHTHPLAGTGAKAVEAGQHTHDYSKLSGSGAGYGFGAGSPVVTAATAAAEYTGTGASGPDHFHTLTGDTGLQTSGDGYHTNLQPTMILNKIIKYRDV